MWWLDPGKEVLNVVFNRILAPYVENLDLDQVNYGIAQGQLTLCNLRLKKGALDKFKLPVDVIQGELGKLSLSLHWLNLGNKPAKILVEDVHLVIVPSNQTDDGTDEEIRVQAVKLERLKNEELLHLRHKIENSEESTQTRGLWESLIAKIVNNIQVTIKNIHIRYEDNLNMIGHSFAAGLYLSCFTAISVNEQWEPAFIESTAGAVHKLATLESLAFYLDTNSSSMIGQNFAEDTSFKSGIGHQFVLKPVSGEGRVVINQRVTQSTPKLDVSLNFDEIGIILDNEQCWDVISLLDTFHLKERRQQYRRFWPKDCAISVAKSRLLFASRAILEGVQQRNQKWTWSYFAQRRDDRLHYVELFEKKLLQVLSSVELQDLEALERKLSYEDIRFYRSITRSGIRKNQTMRQKCEEERTVDGPKPGWTSWLWSSLSKTQNDEPQIFGKSMTSEQRKELYDVLSYDEKTALIESFETPRNYSRICIVAKLNQGSFVLRNDPHGTTQDVTSITFNAFSSTFLQRPDNFEISISLGGFGIFDGITKGTLHPQIVRVKDMKTHHLLGDTDFPPIDNPFLFLKFEKNPLDVHADSALTMKMRHMEIVYHKGYVEAIYKVMKPPPSQLESAETLLNVASRTIDSLRKDTRAVLEFALKTRKTVDLHVDMNAPVIVIPEDVTSYYCNHLIVDAGHISIESNLADGDVVRDINVKGDQQYSDEDFKRLESLMYDRLLLKLEAAQFIVGTQLQPCLDALKATSHDSLHLLQRINIDLQIHQCIVPSVLDLPRFRVFGNLPSLQVNFSDSKYKSLLRLIDICTPTFSNDADNTLHVPGRASSKTRESFQFPSVAQGKEARLEIDSGGGESFEDHFSMSDNRTHSPESSQRMFELDFQVNQLQVSIFKSNANGDERHLGDISFQRFVLSYFLSGHDMESNVKLRSLSMFLVQDQAAEPLPFIVSTNFTPGKDEDLLIFGYRRIRDGPSERTSTQQSISQTIDIQISTFTFCIAPDPVITLYDFFMTTFSGPSDSNRTSHRQENGKENLAPPTEQVIHATVKLARVQVTLVQHLSDHLATLSLSTADVSITWRPEKLYMTGRLGDMGLSNDNPAYILLEKFSPILSIQGQNLAEFQYETYGPSESSSSGITSSLYLKAASVKLNFIKEILRDIYLFFIKFTQAKEFYDAATQVAVQTTSAFASDRMQFGVSIQTPILVFPSNPTHHYDALIVELGMITAGNISGPATNTINASFQGIQLLSLLYTSEHCSVFNMVEDVTISVEIIQSYGIDRRVNKDCPDKQVSISISDIDIHMAQFQYTLLLQLVQAIPEVLAPTSDSRGANQSTENDQHEVIAFTPEVRIATTTESSDIWSAFDILVCVKVVALHLYDSNSISKSTLSSHGIASFTLQDNVLRYKWLSDGTAEAELVLRSFTMTNTRPGAFSFREIIPPATHDRNQFMILYTVSGNPDHTAFAVLTVDAPEIFLAIEPVMAVTDFFSNSVTAGGQPSAVQDAPLVQKDYSTPETRKMGYRVELHELSVTVLQNDMDLESESIKISVQHFLLSQHGVLALSLKRLGMNLVRLGRSPEDVRFMDDVDLTFSLDTRFSAFQQMSTVEVTIQPLIFRASRGDLNLIFSIISKAVNSYNNLGKDSSQESKTLIVDNRPDGSTRAGTKRLSIGNARALVSKEQLTTSFDGFRFVLIGDLHQQPLMHLNVKPFIVAVKDWSEELYARATMATQINYWNLSNSHWEPLLDPWTFTMSVSRDDANCLNGVLSSRERLDINVSSAFIETLTATMRVWAKEPDEMFRRRRGSYAPYRIRNETGSNILVWSDIDGAKEDEPVEILHGHVSEWRFDDWKTAREHVSPGPHNIGVQFVGKEWEKIRNIPVHREGEHYYSIRSKTKHSRRLVLEIRVVDSVKVVTIRSTHQVENLTLYPLELMLVDDKGRSSYGVEKLAPGKIYSIPIDAVAQHKIKIQPDQGFGYNWCLPVRWEELTANSSFSIKCSHSNLTEPAFRVQVWVQTEFPSSISRFPNIHMKLRAPLELENLLPYDLEYRIYDKDIDQNWRSYLKKGGLMPVHSVELGHFIFLNVEIHGTVFSASEFTIINTGRHSNFDVESHLLFRDSRKRELQLRLNYVRYPESGGAFKIQIYSPYIFVNKTGSPFSIRATRSTRAGSQEVAGDTEPDVLRRPFPFLFSHLNKNGHEFLFRVGDSKWSKMVSLEAPMADIGLAIPSQKQKSEEIHLGLSWSEGLGKYRLTKVVTITPRFLVKNDLKETISFREHGFTPREDSLVEPGSRRALQSVHSSAEKLLTVAYPGLNSQWSPPINIEDIGVVHFRMRGNESTAPHLVQADIRVEGSTIFIFFRHAETWPFVIENHSDNLFTFFQKNASMEGKQSQGNIHPTYVLKPLETIRYAWDFPAGRDKKLVLTIGGIQRTVDIMEIGNLVPFRFGDERLKTVSLDVRAEGRQQILRISNYYEKTSMYKLLTRPNKSTGVYQDAVSSSNIGETFEAVPNSVSPTLSLTLELSGIGLSWVDKRMIEVVYATIDAFKVDYCNSAVARTFNVSCDGIQIDDQLHDAIYPVILQPTPISKEKSGVTAPPTVQASITWLHDEDHGVFFVKYCSILLQALTIEMDEDFLFSVYGLFQMQGSSQESGGDDSLLQNIETIPEPSGHVSGQDLYFEVLELQPIKLALSFMRSDRTHDEENTLSSRNPFAVAMNAFTMTVGNVNDAPLELNALGLKDVRLTFSELFSRITYHYRQDILRQLYRILGSADFIGNPVGLFTNVSSGVADIFYEPFHGVVMHGNRELGIGIAKGAASFVKKTVFGLSDSVTKFTSSVGKGLSVATFDPEYQARRRLAQRRNKPRHAIYGVAAGGEALANSVTSAMEGVLMKPIEGAESGGALGFFKGVGKGLVGVVTKPVIGVFDLASNVSEGIRNTTTVFDIPERERVRLPRPIPADGVLRSYSSREALGQYWMKDLNHGVYRQELYVAHINSTRDDAVAMLTLSRILSFGYKTLRLDWELPFTDIQGVTMEGTSLRLAHKSGRECDRYIFIPEKNSQIWFFTQVSSVVKSFNNKKKTNL